MMKKILPFGLPLVRSIIFIVGGLIFILITNQTLNEASRWWSVLCSLYNVLTIILLLVVCKIEKIRYRDLLKFDLRGLKFSEAFKFILMMLLIGIIGMIGFSLLFYQGLPEFLIKPIAPWFAIINLIVLPVTIVLAEMPLYFGYSLKRINNQTKNKYFAICYVTFFYALQHSFIPLLMDFDYMVYRFLSFLPLAIFVGYKFLKEDDLTKALIGHGILDISTAMQVLIVSIL